MILTEIKRTAEFIRLAESVENSKKPIALFKCFRYNMRRNEQRGQGIYVHCVRFNARCPNGYVRSCRNAWPNKSGGFSE